MANKILLSSSISTSNTVFIEAKVSGNAHILKEKTQTGVKNMSYVTALADCEKGSSSPSVGESCMVYGQEGSGDCVLSRKVTTKEGGASGTPYTSETLTFIGV